MGIHHIYARHLRGSFPLSHAYQRGFDDWVRSLQSIDQRPYNLAEIQSFKEQIELKKRSNQDSGAQQS
jgi:hypothetical protein